MKTPALIRTVWVLLIIFFVTLPLPAHAKLYKYRDRSGQLHVVDSPAKVPLEFQNQLDPNDRISPNGRMPEREPPPQAAPDMESPENPRSSGNDENSEDGDEEDGTTSAAKDRQKKLQNMQRKTCEEQLTRARERMKAAVQRYEAWAAENRDKNQIGETRNSIRCDSGDARACIENNRKYRQEKEAALIKSSPYYSEMETLDSQIKRLQKQCGG